jgi:coproporphyrinogen III oxidase-like Fe-S oxidoreductase
MKDFEEFSIECNPYPQDEIYDMIKTLNKRYKNFPRIRFSFGIQSFDNKVLLSTGRESSFPGLVEFIRGLRPLKLDNNIFNLDFIAF